MRRLNDVNIFNPVQLHIFWRMIITRLTRSKFFRAVESSYVKVRTAKKVNTNLATMAVHYKMHDKHKIDCVHVYVQVK